jgi:hypothetical protein
MHLPRAIAIGEQVLERTPSAPPSAISIELKQAAAELGLP